MKLNGISQTYTNKVAKQNNYQKNEFKTAPMMADSVSFTGLEIKKPFKKAIATVAAVLTLLNVVPRNDNGGLRGIIPSASASTMEQVDADFPELDFSIPNLQENQEFQLNQTKNAVSLTIDNTGNYAPRVYEPFASSIVLTPNPDKNRIEERNDLVKAMIEMYGFGENQTVLQMHGMEAILQTNPVLLSAVTGGEVDYTQGAASNIDPELMLTTDYTSYLKEPTRIYLPDVVVTERVGDKKNTGIVFAQVYNAKNADENGFGSLELTKNNFLLARSDEKRINVIDKALARAYGISNIDSHAGVAIWHGIYNDENNKELFAGFGEQDAPRALVEYYEANGAINLSLPPLVVYVNDELGAKISPWMLTAERDEDVIISYVTPDRAVLELDDTKKISPLDILGCHYLPDGSNVRELYESNPEQYLDLALIIYGQTIDNNNALLELGIRRDELTAESLTKILNFTQFKDEDAKIMLEPVAIEHPEGEYVAQPPKKPSDDDGTEPTTEPTDPTTEPTTEPTDPTDPTETTCPSNPDITKPTGEIDDDETEPTRPSKPSNPTEPTKGEDCPTEPSQPTSGEGGSSADDDGGDFGETQPPATQPPATQPPATQPPATQPPATQPPATQPPATQPSGGGNCPTEPSQPASGEGGSSADDDGADF